MRNLRKNDPTKVGSFLDTLSTYSGRGVGEGSVGVAGPLPLPSARVLEEGVLGFAPPPPHQNQFAPAPAKLNPSQKFFSTVTPLTGHSE